MGNTFGQLLSDLDPLTYISASTFIEIIAVIFLLYFVANALDDASGGLLGYLAL